MQHIDDAERRRRILTRHGFAPGARLPDVPTAVEAMTVLHATDTATVYLSLHARIDQLSVADVDRALYDDRSVIRQLAMRRTLFGVPRDLLPAVLGSAGARLAAQQRRALAKDVEQSGLSADGTAWLHRAEAAIGARLAGGDQLTAPQIREQVPEVAGALEMYPDKTYGGSFPVAPRVLTVMSAAGEVVRARQLHHWRLNKPTWMSMEAWLGQSVAPVAEAEGYAALVGRWLRTFGPGTETDLVWWLGATKVAVRHALTAVAAVEVSLDGGGTGWVLPDDLDPTPEPEPSVALLPTLDPTVMGWKERGFLFGDLEPDMFDRSGNAGTTAWVDGELVGCWVQDKAGVASVSLIRDVPAAEVKALDVEAERITAWCEGVQVNQIWVSTAMKQASAALGG